MEGSIKGEGTLALCSTGLSIGVRVPRKVKGPSRVRGLKVEGPHMNKGPVRSKAPPRFIAPSEVRD